MSSSSAGTMYTTPTSARNDPELSKLDHCDSTAKEFGFIPIPNRLRYDPATPFYFGTMINVSFGVFSTFSKFFALHVVGGM
jgi:hypothetical protein